MGRQYKYMEEDLGTVSFCIHNSHNVCLPLQLIPAQICASVGCFSLKDVLVYYTHVVLYAPWFCCGGVGAFYAWQNGDGIPIEQ